MSRQKGMYTGGMTVLGYKAVNKKLEIVPEEAEIVKFIFRRYIEIQSPKHIARELNAQNITTKNGFKWNRNRVNVILNNYVYNGKIFYHHQTVFDGEHEAIIDDDTWNRTREIMKANANSNDLTKRTRQDIPMRGKAFCGHCDKAFIPSYSKKKQIAYYYYSCSNHDESSEVCNNCPIRKLPAELIEDFAKAQFEKILKSKDILKLLSEKTGYPPRIILDIFYENFWANVTKEEFTRMVHLLIDKITVYNDHVDMDIKYGGLKSIEKDFTEK